MTTGNKQQIFFELIAKAMRAAGVENCVFVYSLDQNFGVSMANTENADPNTTKDFEALRVYLTQVFAHATGDTNSKKNFTIIK